ncbi:MAG: beta-ketoacyl-[acyl-carrier-protein] synthase family protein [Deltaproteobacteria bacterium]|nr:beta-ketoacyl-[acyl-carrier-protein] synthase family protein [Deltaproteobacteria bacterium]
MLTQRVVITGRGAVSPYGVGVEALVEGIWAGRSAVQRMEAWRGLGGLRSLLAAPVPEYDAKKAISRHLRRNMGPMAVNSAVASLEAVAEAGLSEAFLQSGDVGVALGSTTGSPGIWEQLYTTLLRERSIDSIKSGEFFKIMGNSCAANVMFTLGLKGEQWGPSSACTSSAQAIGLGYLLVKSGRQKAVLCGGAEEVHQSVTTIFDVLGATSCRNDEPGETPRPFDRDRDGVVCGGGAGVLVLESLESALERGAAIEAELIGFGHVSDPGHIAHPDPEAMGAAMRAALREARVDAADVDYVNAHATGTPQGDVAEAHAIAAVLGGDVPVSSLKGHIGHTLGAAGVLESVLALEMLRRQELVPTLHLESPDPECEVVHLLRRPARDRIDTVLKNNFAMGGVNVALVFRKWQGG